MHCKHERIRRLSRRLILGCRTVPGMTTSDLYEWLIFILVWIQVILVVILICACAAVRLAILTPITTLVLVRRTLGGRLHVPLGTVLLDLFSLDFLLLPLLLGNVGHNAVETTFAWGWIAINDCDLLHNIIVEPFPTEIHSEYIAK